MKSFFKIIIELIISISLLSSISIANSILYKKAETKPISTGAVLTKYNILTEDGWVTANVVSLNTNDDYNKIGLLTNPSGDRYLSTIANMTKRNNAILGINADFFAGRNGIGHAIGLAVDNNIVASSTTSLNKGTDKYASFILDEDDNFFYEYVSSNITATFDDGLIINIRDINKYSDDYSTASLFNEKFGKYSIGSSDDLPLTEIVVQNDKVIEIRNLDGWCKIPKDGYVISILNNVASEWLNQIKVGSRVKIDTEYYPNIKNIKFAVSGGAKLLENGMIPETFSHNVTGRNPRTAIGTNKSEDTIYLITIDGRIKSSIGMTQEEEADFLASIGVYNAINLDGGGSTTMVGKLLGDTEIKEINIPSEGSERRVTNGVGIFNDAPDSQKLDSLVIEVRDPNILKGEERKVSVKGYNKYLQGVEIDEEDIKWDYDGVEVRVEDGQIIGDTPGNTTLIAKIGKAEGSIELNILEDVNEIYVYPKIKHINPGEKINYTLKSKDKNGNYAITMLNSYDLSIYEYYSNNELQNDIPSDAYFNDLVFSANQSGTYILKISKGSCTTFAKVLVGSENFVLIDDFEKEDFSFDPYPDEVGGDAYLSDIQSYEGKYSAKLDYDFDRDAKIRGAYLMFDTPQIIPTDALRLAFWVYNDEYKDEQLKIKTIDSNGEVKIIVAQDNISHDGWGKIEVDLSSYSLPLEITDIYLAQHDENIRSKGFIYIDKLGYYSSKVSKTDNVKMPIDIRDYSNDEIDLTSENSFNIAFVDEINTSNLMINWLKNNTMISKLNDCDLTVFTNKLSSDVKNKYIYNNNSEENIEVPTDDEQKRFIAYSSKIKTDYIENDGYKVDSNDYCTIISLDVTQNGIRKTDASQFINIERDIKNEDTGNIIIVINDSIDNFSDVEERLAFLDILQKLSQKKNIIVVHKGFYSNYSMEYGIRFLGINSENTELSNVEGHTLLTIAVSKKLMSYKYERILGKKIGVK